MHGAADTFCTARVAPEKAVFRPALPSHSLPEFTGERMGKLTYFEQLKDPRWQKRRLQVMERDEWACQVCGDSESTLNVHHKHYFKGRAPWEYEDSELITLCESCHEMAGAQEDERKRLFARLRVDGPYSIGEAIGLLAGWANQNCGYDLSEFQHQSPYNFRLGEALDLLDVFVWDIGTLIEFRDALAAVSAQHRREALDEMLAALKKRASKQ